MNRVGVFNLGQNGRLGNQLFQIFSAWGYAKKHNYSLHLNHVPILDYLKIEYYEVPFECKTVFTDKNSLEYVQIPKYNDIILSGYFQNPQYWDWNRFDSDINVFSWQNSHLFVPLSKTKKNCFIHVRRGDYVKVASVLLTPNYYYDAIEIIKNKFGDDVEFNVFSDDIDYCKKIFEDYDFIYHENNSEIEDIILMSQCDYGILSNSSFSWWGAYMENYKSCILPRHWFRVDKIDTLGLLPVLDYNWTTIWKDEYYVK